MSSDQLSETAKVMVPDMSVSDALRLASAFEQRAQQFYRALAERVHPEAREVVLELADEELKHYQLLQKVALGGGLEHMLEERLSTPPTQQRFDDFVALPELPDWAAEEAVLDYAESRERIALEHYGHLAQLAPVGPLRDLFAFLRDEEKRHEAGIQSRWAALFSIY
jgi:rubrerythrin